jgi:hypothetical protein
VTHRCPNRQFLLRFALDRHGYRTKRREHLPEFDVALLDYCITSNHDVGGVRKRQQTIWRSITQARWQMPWLAAVRCSEWFGFAPQRGNNILAQGKGRRDRRPGNRAPINSIFPFPVFRRPIAGGKQEKGRRFLFELRGRT